MQRVHLLTPTYDGSCHVAMVKSLIEEIFILKSAGIAVTWDTYPGCCYLPIARNMLVKQFMESDGTDLIFLDTDVSWMPGGILKLLRWDRDIVAGIYPYKSDVESYPVVHLLDNDRRPVVDPITGLIEADAVPTGFMRIRRNVFEEMKEHYHELKVIDRKNPEKLVEYDCYFDTKQIGDTWYGEDIHFCKLWRAIGGRIWIEPDITFWHHGLKAWKGNWHEYLRRLPGGGGPPEKDWNFALRT